MDRHTLLLLVLAGCILLADAALPADRFKGKPRQTPSQERYNFFDVDLFQALNRAQRKDNILVSPLSVKLVLGMVMEGARGQTADEIRLAMRLPRDPTAAREAFGKWLKSLQGKSKSTLEIANQMFISNKTPVLEDFRATLERSYNSDVTPVDFAAREATVQMVNSWANSKTRGMIPQLLGKDDVAHNTKLLLANAVYFKGRWASPFDADRTSNKCFFMDSNVCQQTPMMIQTGTFDYGYIDTLDAQAIDLPYEDGKFSMLIVLPRTHDGMQQLGLDMIHDHQEHILAQLERHEVVVQLPRFEIDFRQDLVEALAGLHIKQVFGPKADLSGITNEALSVGKVFHSSKMVVNEEGSEAAAATGALFVPLIGTSMTMFTAEHPFFFSIRDTSSGSILFAGRLSRPQEADMDVFDAANEPPDSGPEMPSKIQTVAPPVLGVLTPEKPNRRPGRPDQSARPPSRPGGFNKETVGYHLETQDKSAVLSTGYQEHIVETFTITYGTRAPPITTRRPQTAPPPPPPSTTMPPPSTPQSPFPPSDPQFQPPAPATAKPEFTDPPPLFRPSRTTTTTPPPPPPAPQPLSNSHLPVFTEPPPLVPASTLYNVKRNVATAHKASPVFTGRNYPRAKWFFLPDIEYSDLYRGFQQAPNSARQVVRDDKFADRISFFK